MMQQGKANIIMNNYGNGFSADGSNKRGVAIPIPSRVRKNHKMHVSSNDFFSSSDDSSSCSCSPDSPAGGYVPLSSSHQGFSMPQVVPIHNSNNVPLNVYGTSPRTSVMFNYYSSPKGVYGRPHHPLLRTKSTDSSRTTGSSRHTIDFTDTGLDKTTSGHETSAHVSQKKSKVPAISNQHYQQLDDSRPRAWSESDKHRSGNTSSLQNCRMSALRKLKMKLGQKGSLKRQKSREDEDHNRSGASITSLEKVEEGRQLHCVSSPKQCFPHDRSTSPKPPTIAPVSLMHQEHETRKWNERRMGVVKHQLSPQGQLPRVRENPEHHLIYQRFLEEHTCYDLMPTSSKLVVFDTRLEVRKAFHALVENSLRCAPLWDNELCDFVGLLTVSDFVNILLAYHRCPNKKLEDLENQKISCWRQVLNSKKTLIHLPPEASIFDALKKLTEENIRRLAILNPSDGDIYHVINHRRILHFLFLFMNELPKPEYMSKTLRELGIGTLDDVCTIREESPVIDALKLISEHKISGLPVIDALGRVSDVFTKTDILVLAGEKLFYDLSIKVKDVISLHAAFDVNDNMKPKVMRTMPGSPALVRRKNQSRSGHGHPQSSTPNASSNHLFLRNAGRKAPSSLVVSNDPHSKDKPMHHTNVKGHSGKAINSDKIQVWSKGDPPTFSPPTSQPLLHRRRHLSSNKSRTSSFNPHLVTVTLDDTLEFIVNSVVNADVPQAVIVDEADHVKGVVSVGDILRFMVYPTNEKGEVIRNQDGSILLSRSMEESKPPLGKSLSARQFTRTRATSDDSDLKSANHTQFTSEAGHEAPNRSVSSSPHGTRISSTSTEDSGYCNSISPQKTPSNTEPLLSAGSLIGGDDIAAEFSSLSLDDDSKPLQPLPKTLGSGEKIQRL